MVATMAAPIVGQMMALLSVSLLSLPCSPRMTKITVTSIAVTSTVAAIIQARSFTFQPVTEVPPHTEDVAERRCELPEELVYQDPCLVVAQGAAKNVTEPVDTFRGNRVEFRENDDSIRDVHRKPGIHVGSCLCVDDDIVVFFP